MSNTLKFDLVEADFRDMSICFDFGNFSKMMSLVSDNYEDFEIKISYMEDKELGMIFVRKLDDSENYFLMSKVD
ncbi:MAG: hypothetical protein ACYSSM_04670, partial [Planctomycetota bacterium]|jgi:hypothetical protein